MKQRIITGIFLVLFLVPIVMIGGWLFHFVIGAGVVIAKSWRNDQCVVFTHKPNCPGILYHGTVSGKDTVFCSHCQTFCTLNKYKRIKDISEKATNDINEALEYKTAKFVFLDFEFVVQDPLFVLI